MKVRYFDVNEEARTVKDTRLARASRVCDIIDFLWFKWELTNLRSKFICTFYVIYCCLNSHVIIQCI